MSYNFPSAGHYPSSCLLFKTHDWQFSYFTGNTLRLRYEPNRLMQSLGLWRWYINITVTVLDINHRPVFYLKHVWQFSYFTGNTLRLRFESNRLMRSIGLWRWYVSINIAILCIIYRIFFYLKRRLSETGCCLWIQRTLSVVPRYIGSTRTQRRNPVGCLALSMGTKTDIIITRCNIVSVI
jgi:hypothetical protein